MYKNLLVATDGSEALGQGTGACDRAGAGRRRDAHDILRGARLSDAGVCRRRRLRAGIAQGVREARGRRTRRRSSTSAATKAEAAGRRLQDRLCDRQRAVGSDPGRGEEAQMRCDRDGLAWPARDLRGAARQRDAEGTDSHQAAGDRRPLTRSRRAAQAVESDSTGRWPIAPGAAGVKCAFSRTAHMRVSRFLSRP